LNKKSSSLLTPPLRDGDLVQNAADLTHFSIRKILRNQFSFFGGMPLIGASQPFFTDLLRVGEKSSSRS